MMATEHEKDEYIRSLTATLRKQQEAAEALQQQHSNQIQALQNLLQIEAQSTVSEKRKNEKLQEAIREYQELLKISSTGNSQLERRLNEKVAEYESLLQSKDQTIARFQREIKSLNDQLEVDPREQLERELEVFYPAAARSSRSLRRSSSAIPTSSDYNDELQQLREENARLVSEAQENAPLTLAKVLEHKKAVEMIAELQQQITDLINEKSVWDEERDELVQLRKQTERSLKRFQQENEDLSRQVKCLLHVMHKKSGRSLSSQLQSFSPSNSSPANQVVSTRLVTFESIDELQEQNRKLLAAIRELSEDHEMNESMNSSNVNEEAIDALEKAVKEIEELKAERKRQSEVLEAVIKQRDSLQTINAALTTLSSLSSIQTGESATAKVDQYTEFLKSKLEEKENEINGLRKEIENKAKEVVNEVNKVREELMSSKAQERNLLSKLEASQANLETCKSLLEQSKMDFETLREKIIEKKDHKKIENDLKKTSETLAEVTSKLKKAEDMLKNITEERDMLKEAELTLRIENEALKREIESSQSIGESAKTLQNCISQMEADGNRARIAESLVEKLEKEVTILRARLAKSAKDATAEFEANSKVVEDLKKRLQTEEDTNQRLTNQVAELQKQVEELKKSLIAARRGIQTVGPIVTEKASESGEAGQTEDKSTRRILSLGDKGKADAPELKNRVDTLQMQLTETTNHLKVALAACDEKENRLKRIAGQAKQRISTLQETINEKNEQIKNMTDQNPALLSISANTEKVTQLEKKVQALEQENEDLLRFRLINSQLESKIEKMAKEIQELAAQKAQLEEKLRSQSDGSSETAVPSTSQASIIPLNSSSQPPTQPVRPLPQQQLQPKTATIIPQPQLRPPTSTIAHVFPTQQTPPIQPVPEETSPMATSETSQEPAIVPMDATDEPSQSESSNSAIAMVIPTQQSPVVESVQMVAAPEVPTEPTAEENAADVSMDSTGGDDQGVPEPERHDSPPRSPSPPIGSPQQESATQHSPASDAPVFDDSASQPEGQKRALESTDDDDAGSSKRSRTEQPSQERRETATLTSGIESSDTNEDSSDRRRQSDQAPHDPVVDDVIVIDDNSDAGYSNNDGQGEERDEENDDSESEHSESEANSSEVENESDASEESEISRSRGEESDEDDERRGTDDDDDDDEEHDTGRNDEQDDEEAVIVIGESNESQNDNSEHSEERIVGGEGESDQQDNEATSEVVSQPPSSSAFIAGQSSQVFAVPEEQRIGSRPMYLGHPAPSYEESDSIVPSTPTLVVPRRGDGPESLNSPRVPQSSFQFAGNSREGSPSASLEPEAANPPNDDRQENAELTQFSENSNVAVASERSQDSTPVEVPDEKTTIHGESVTPEPSTSTSDVSQEIPQDQENKTEEVPQPPLKIDESTNDENMESETTVMSPAKNDETDSQNVAEVMESVVESVADHTPHVESVSVSETEAEVTDDTSQGLEQITASGEPSQTSETVSSTPPLATSEASQEAPQEVGSETTTDVSGDTNQAVRKPVVWSTATSAPVIRPSTPDVTAPVQAGAPGVSIGRRIRLRGPRAFQTARRAQGWRGTRGGGRGAGAAPPQ